MCVLRQVFIMNLTGMELAMYVDQNSLELALLFLLLPPKSMCTAGVALPFFREPRLGKC